MVDFERVADHLGQGDAGSVVRSQRVQLAQLGRHQRCTNIGECEAVCPKGINLSVIARMNQDFRNASIASRREPGEDPVEAKRWAFSK